MPFRFVHTADVHLDSPLRSLALRDPELGELIGGATRRAFERIVELCLEERADALMIAGDLYDGDQTSMKTALFLAAQLRRLDEAGIRTFIVRGNHDAQSRITRELVLPDSVEVFDGRGGAREPDRPRGGIPVAVHGVSFARPRAPESLLPKFGPPRAGAFNIGLLHTSLSGSAEHDTYAPCSVAELASAGFDYWCLGHVHKRRVHSEAPFVVMPGIPQGRGIGEAGPKSVTMVDVGDDGSVACRERATALARFERAAVDLAGVEDRRGMAVRIGARLEEARAAVDADHLVVRLELRGATALNRRLRRDPELVETEARDRAAAVGAVWIEKVDIETGEPGVEAAGVDGAGPMAELAAEMRRRAAGADGFREAAERLLDDLERALPPEARRAFGDGEAERREALARLGAEGCEAVLAHLRGGEGGGAE